MVSRLVRSQSWGRAAIEAAGNGPVAQGNHGAGAGAKAGALKGGVGTASVRLPDGTTVGALAIVNAVGSTVDDQGRFYGERYGFAGEFPDLQTPTEQPPGGAPGGGSASSASGATDPGGVAGAATESAPTGGSPAAMNTVIAVVATDVPLDKAAVKRMAMVAHDGMARAIDPIHTLVDGDSVFAVSTGEPPRLSVTDPAALMQLETVFAAGARALSRAIVHGMLAAETVDSPAGKLISYRDAYPSAMGDVRPE